MWFSLFRAERIFVYVSAMAGMIVFHLSSITNHERTHTRWPLLVPSLPLVFSLRSLYSDHVRPGPCRWPSKERLITGKVENSVCFPFLCLSFLGLVVLLLLCQYLLALYLAFCLSHTLPFSSPHHLYFLLCWVKFENTPPWILPPQIPACSLWDGYQKRRAQCKGLN